jgi:hypothetical protein
VILFEIGDRTFDNAYRRNHELTNVGHFSNERWSKIERLCLLFPSKAQTYHCKTAAHPHGQCMFRDFVAALMQRPHFPKCSLYHGNKNYESNGFMYVRNDCPITASLPWRSIVRLIDEYSKDPSKLRHSPGNFANFGYTNWTSLSTTPIISVLSGVDIVD